MLSLQPGSVLAIASVYFRERVAQLLAIRGKGLGLRGENFLGRECKERRCLRCTTSLRAARVLRKRRHDCDRRHRYMDALQFVVRHSLGLTTYQKVLQRVNRIVVDTNLVVQVRPGRTSCRTNSADRLGACDRLPQSDIDV